MKSVDDLVQFINDKSISCKSRSPNLAKLELISKIGGLPENWDSIETVFYDYCEKFRTKPSTFSDLESYFNLIANKDDVKMNIIQKLFDTQDEDMNIETESLDAICCKYLLPYQLAVCEIYYYKIIT